MSAPPDEVLAAMAEAARGIGSEGYGPGLIVDALSAADAMGWQLVPKEATQEMLRAAGASSDGVSPRGGVDWLGKMLPKYWHALLAAAPKVGE